MHGFTPAHLHVMMTIPARMVAAVVLFKLFLAGPLVQAQISREYDVKAVFLLNFAQFVEWPPGAFPDAQSPFVITVLGTDPFGRSLVDTFKDEAVLNHKVIVRHLDRFENLEDLGLCHILFVSTSERRHLSRILAALRGRPILTVSDLEGFARRGGMIELYMQDAKVRLRIDNWAAQAAHLVISSKLLRVAEVVPPPPAE